MFASVQTSGRNPLWLDAALQRQLRPAAVRAVAIRCQDAQNEGNLSCLQGATFSPVRLRSADLVGVHDSLVDFEFSSRQIARVWHARGITRLVDCVANP